MHSFVAEHKSQSNVKLDYDSWGTKLESFQYAPAPWAIAIVVFLSPITISNNNYFLCPIYRKCIRLMAIQLRSQSLYLAPISHQFHSSIFTVFVLARMFTIYIQSESLVWGRSNGHIFIWNGALLQELWAGWIRMTLCKFKLRHYSFCSASFAPVLRSVPVRSVSYFTMQNTGVAFHILVCYGTVIYSCII